MVDCWGQVPLISGESLNLKAQTWHCTYVYTIYMYIHTLYMYMYVLIYLPCLEPDPTGLSGRGTPWYAPSKKIYMYNVMYTHVCLTWLKVRSLLECSRFLWSKKPRRFAAGQEFPLPLLVWFDLGTSWRGGECRNTSWVRTCWCHTWFACAFTCTIYNICTHVHDSSLILPGLTPSSGDCDRDDCRSAN